MEEQYTPVEDEHLINWPLRDLILGVTLIGCSLFVFNRLLILLYPYFPWHYDYIASCIDVLWTSILLIFPLYICRARGFWPVINRISARQIPKELLSAIWYLIVLSLAVGATVVAIEAIFKLFFHIDIKTPSESVQTLKNLPPGFQVLIISLLGFTVAPVAEEVFFRGFLFNALKSRLSFPIAISLQALLFALCHKENPFNTFVIFLLGLGLAIIYDHKKSLTTPILVHALKNSIVTVPVLVLAFQNIHTPATTWDDASHDPKWLSQAIIMEVPVKKDGMEQRQFAIDTWGSKGSRQWKKEAIAFRAVDYRFPEDTEACIKARLGIIEIYVYDLRDYRRAIIEADKVLSEYPDHREECAEALSYEGWSYFMLKDFRKCRMAFERVINDYKDVETYYEYSSSMMEWLKQKGYLL